MSKMCGDVQGSGQGLTKATAPMQGKHANTTLETDFRRPDAIASDHSCIVNYHETLSMRGGTCEVITLVSACSIVIEIYCPNT